MESNSVTRKYYQGCYASDKIPNIENLRFPASLIFNLDEAKNEGSHWTCVFINGRKEANYFDSYAQQPEGDIKEFLNKFNKLRMNQYPYQSLTSDVCGHYCIVFLYYFSLGHTYDTFLKKLNTSENPDLFVKLIVNKMLK